MRIWLLPVHQTYRCVFRGGFLCLITAVLEKTARNPATQRRMPARPIFLNGLKRGTPPCLQPLKWQFKPPNLLVSEKVLKKSGPQNPRGPLSTTPPLELVFTLCWRCTKASLLALVTEMRVTSQIRIGCPQDPKENSFPPQKKGRTRQI